MSRETIAEIACDPAVARVFEHGWQSWSPTATYAGDATSPRPLKPEYQAQAFRPDRPAPAEGFQGEGLLAVDPGDGSPVRVFSAPDPAGELASITAQPRDGLIVVAADGPVTDTAHDGDLPSALASWADGVSPGPVAALGPAWCSWYQYFTKVTAADVVENLEAIDELDLPIDIVQIDDGWEPCVGDWDRVRPEFGDLADTAARIRASGRRAGIWLAPFLVASASALAERHPEWLVGGADAGRCWEQELAVLDVTRPDAAEWLQDAVRALREMGFDYFKLDFLYAGAQQGRRSQDLGELDAYRHGIALLREAAGPDATFLGCGAPLLASIGLFEAMRISPDIDPVWDRDDGDLSQPSGAAAEATGAARAFQHARLWVNDPDCLIARPEVEQRERWAAHVEASGGLACSSDRLRGLDDWGLETTRRLLVPSSTSPVELAQPTGHQGPRDR